MPNLNGTGPFGDQNWICRRAGAAGGNSARGGRGYFCRMGAGKGMGRGMGFNNDFYKNAPYYNNAPVEAQSDTAAEINALKEKITSLENALNKIKIETGE